MSEAEDYLLRCASRVGQPSPDLLTCGDHVIVNTRRSVMWDGTWKEGEVVAVDRFGVRLSPVVTNDPGVIVPWSEVVSITHIFSPVSLRYHGFMRAWAERVKGAAFSSLAYLEWHTAGEDEDLLPRNPVGSRYRYFIQAADEAIAYHAFQMGYEGERTAVPLLTHASWGDGE